MTGLFVKFGIDECADLLPLKNIYRTQIKELGEYLGLPEEILGRTPNPDILPGVTDKYMSYFGLHADTVDLILMGLERNLDTLQIAQELNIEEKDVSEMKKIVELSRFTRSRGFAPKPSDGDIR